MNAELTMVKTQIKENIVSLVSQDELAKSQKLVDQYIKEIKDDAEIFSIQCVIHLKNNNFDDAKKAVEHGLAIDNANFDLLFNLAYIYELKKEYIYAALIYRKLSKGSYTAEQQDIALVALKRLETQKLKGAKPRKKLAIFVRKGFDSFLGDIIDNLSYNYIVKKFIITDSDQIAPQMKWADICWFEWCDILIGYASNNLDFKNKKIICRLHSFEAFDSYMQSINWKKIDQLIFVADHIRNFLLKKMNQLDAARTCTIPNGIDLSKYTFAKRTPGYNIAYLGYINYKKGPMLLLHTFKAIHDYDSRYKLFMAGEFQDERDVLYFKQMIQAFQLQGSIIYDGWQDNVDEWLNDKDYIISTSILEAHPISIMQAMAKGIKPLIHNFVGAQGIYPEQYIWNTIDQCVKMLSDGQYNSQEYRNFIAENYALEKQISRIVNVLES